MLPPLCSSWGGPVGRMFRTLAMHKAHAPLPLPAGHARMPPGLEVWFQTGCIAERF